MHLGITHVFFSEFIDPEFELEEGEKKEKIVFLGTGFSSLGFLSGLHTKKFDVTVVSPRSYMLYTPDLAKGATNIERYTSQIIFRVKTYVILVL